MMEEKTQLNLPFLCFAALLGLFTVNKTTCRLMQMEVMFITIDMAEPSVKQF
jgi:hypothetical protein